MKKKGKEEDQQQEMRQRARGTRRTDGHKIRKSKEVGGSKEEEEERKKKRKGNGNGKMTLKGNRKGKGKGEGEGKGEQKGEGEGEGEGEEEEQAAKETREHEAHLCRQEWVGRARVTIWALTHEDQLDKGVMGSKGFISCCPAPPQEDPHPEPLANAHLKLIILARPEPHGGYVWAHAQIGQEAQAEKEFAGQAGAKCSTTAAADCVVWQKGPQPNWQLLALCGVETVAEHENLGAITLMRFGLKLAFCLRLGVTISLWNRLQLRLGACVFSVCRPHKTFLEQEKLRRSGRVKGDRDDLQACQLPGLRRCAQLLQPGQEGAVRVVQKPRKRAWRAHHQLCDSAAAQRSELAVAVRQLALASQQLVCHTGLELDLRSAADLLPENSAEVPLW
ncbi:MAG: hypothetical protein FRX49_02725 [Trebouxia sp. A1-2]|nr:MAG: hypothetical protein FRX49_02725 [Trebouxia sp. A1-2]